MVVVAGGGYSIYLCLTIIAFVIISSVQFSDEAFNNHSNHSYFLGVCVFTLKPWSYPSDCVGSKMSTD